MSDADHKASLKEVSVHFSFLFIENQYAIAILKYYVIFVYALHKGITKTLFSVDGLEC
jgi:hypothetical protein